MRAIVLTILCGFPEISSAIDDWTRTDSERQAVVVALGVVDIALTKRGLDELGMMERNPILGRKPSPARLWTLGASGIVAHTALAVVLPRRWREGWQAAGIAVELTMCASNAAIVFGGRF
jgi:4'-phosphopantetheinyl transferase EntD